MTQLQACFVDLAEEDEIDAAKIQRLAGYGAPWTGIGLQSSNGPTLTFPSWFPSAWKAAGPSPAPDVFNPAYGKTWFRFAYHYFVLAKHQSDETANTKAQVENGQKQADLMLDTIGNAGGFDAGDLNCGVDIESGEQPAGYTASDVIAGISAFSMRVQERTGKQAMLYGSTIPRELGITSRMWCEYLWFPYWARTLNWKIIESMGWDEASTLLWQDVGDGSDTAPPGYPHVTPIGDALDVSIMVLQNMPYEQQLAWLAANAGLGNG